MSYATPIMTRPSSQQVLSEFFLKTCILNAKIQLAPHPVSPSIPLTSLSLVTSAAASTVVGENSAAPLDWIQMGD